MICLPILKSLDVDGYGLFPGAEGKPGLHITFQRGLTLVLGANGLGKSTLVTLLYRMFTGPFDVPGLTSSGAVGTAKIEATKLPSWDRRALAARVVDNAKDAHATLVFGLGNDEVRVIRNLSTLDLVDLRHGDETLQATDDRYHQLVTDLSSLPSFGDWILVLRYLTFYFEDRRALVWDPTAQRQILRLLMLPRATAAKWAVKEREVLELDSRVRNLNSALNREEGAERRAKAQAKDAKSLLTEIEALESKLSTLLPELERCTDDLPRSDAERQAARLRSLTAEQERDVAYRGLERIQLSRISEAFPDHAQTARYLIGRLLSTDVCQTCGSSVPEFVAELEHRLALSHCVICSSHLSSKKTDLRAIEAEIRKRTRQLLALEEALAAAQSARDGAEQAYDQLISGFARLDNEVAQCRARIAALVQQLPAGERALREQSDAVSSLRGRVEVLQRELDILRSAFEAQVRHDMLTIAARRSEVIEMFQTFAEGFLFESCKLNWTPHKDQVGQTGPTVDYPAFEFEMSGSDFPSAVRRRGPDQVSESQREFIDLAFRMTLMAVAAESGVGSLIVDAPESSLDAVFSEQAAKVLARFASPKSTNRLMITSNLVDGQLIPNLMAATGIKSRSSKRVVDLLEIAVPTAAVRAFASSYAKVRDDLFARAR